MNSPASSPKIGAADALRLDRVVVVGTSGSGKTTLARTLATLLDAKHIEIDALHWKPNWVERPREELRAAAAEAVTAERWVADGNYGSIRDIMWGRATTVVWLNYPFHIVLRRILSRTIRRIVSREVLYSQNRETFYKSFLTRDSIILWVFRTYRSNRRRYRELFAERPFPGLEMVEFRSPVLVGGVWGSGGVGGGWVEWIRG